MASKTKTPTARVADLKTRFARIRTAILAIDALTVDYLERVAGDLEGAAGEIADLTQIGGEQPPAN